LLSIDHVGERFRIAMVVPPYFDVPPKAYGGVEAVVPIWSIHWSPVVTT
jgi:hypothetical protein